MNMSHCRFRNTLLALEDCQEHIEDDLSDNYEEQEARELLIGICREIATIYED